MEEFLRYYDHFVLPFAVGTVTLFVVVGYKYVRWFMGMERGERRRVRGRIFSWTTAGGVWETVRESLLHVKIWRVNPVLGYMHTSLALGWFLLIVVGWVESSLHFSAAIMPPYTHVFFKFFGPSGHGTMASRFVGFLMDALLLFVLSGVLLAWVKRVRSRMMGMRRTTRHTLWDTLAMMSLWFIFPARLLAESATSGIDGGHTFLTGTVGEWLLHGVGIQQLYLINAGAWWFYSLVLGAFFVAMPFSRYMHIFTEVPLIFLRRWGVKAGEDASTGDNFQIEACSRCGICLDPCQMQTAAGVDTIQATYYLRDRRYHRLTRDVAENCLMCGRCEARCPVGVEVAALRLGSRKKYNDVPAEGRYDYLVLSGDGAAAEGRTGYFAGCMTLLQPQVLRGMETIFAAAGDDVWWADRKGGACCGRPLKLSGETSAARRMMEFNADNFRRAGVTTLVTSCPICLRTFRDEYDLEGIEVLHHSQYIARLLEEGRIAVAAAEETFTYHDPCELGRGCGIYDEPRAVIETVGALVEPGQTRRHALCCGGSLGNVSISNEVQDRIGADMVRQLEATGAGALVTACPQCRKSVASHSRLPVLDLAEVVAQNLLP